MPIDHYSQRCLLVYLKLEVLNLDGLSRLIRSIASCRYISVFMRPKRRHIGPNCRRCYLFWSRNGVITQFYRCLWSYWWVYTNRSNLKCHLKQGQCHWFDSKSGIEKEDRLFYFSYCGVRYYLQFYHESYLLQITFCATDTACSSNPT